VLEEQEQVLVRQVEPQVALAGPDQLWHAGRKQLLAPDIDSAGLE